MLSVYFREVGSHHKRHSTCYQRYPGSMPPSEPRHRDQRLGAASREAFVAHTALPHSLRRRDRSRCFHKAQAFPNACNKVTLMWMDVLSVRVARLSTGSSSAELAKVTPSRKAIITRGAGLAFRRLPLGRSVAPWMTVTGQCERSGPRQTKWEQWSWYGHVNSTSLGRGCSVWHAPKLLQSR